MKRLCAVALMVVATTPADAAKTICLTGDSANLVPRTSVNAPNRTGATNVGRCIGELVKSLPAESAWKNATVIDLSIPGTNPSDWLGPVDAARCTSFLTPCSSDPQADCEHYYPHANAACRAGDGLLDHLPATCDIFLMLGDGGGPLDPADQILWVDEIEEVRDRLDDADLGDGVILATPPKVRLMNGNVPYLPCPGGIFDSIRLEMVTRPSLQKPGGEFDGLVFPETPHIVVAFDCIHPNDLGHIEMCDAWVRALP